MDNLILLLLFSFVCASILLTYISSIFNQTSKHANLPPGPRPFPIIGNILELGTNPHQTLTKLSKIYGPVMSLKLGNITTIVISSPQAAKKVLNENSRALSNRTVLHAIQVLDHHNHSIVFLPPEDKWRTLRKVCATKIFSPQQIDSLHKFSVNNRCKNCWIMLRKVEIKDLFVAGVVTSSRTVEWTMAGLLRHPEKLAKARKELCQVIGKDVTSKESHILKLPFLQAVVKETLRLYPPGPLLVPHKCDERV